MLPTAWFRNTWSWDVDATKPELGPRRRRRRRSTTRSSARSSCVAGPAPTAPRRSSLFCENETNDERLYGSPGPPFPKDGINDHVVARRRHGQPRRRGTKAAYWYRVEVAAGATVELRLRLRPAGSRVEPRRGRGLRRGRATRRAEADEFYAELTPAAASADEAQVMRQAFAGMLWSKQLYDYDVERWLDGDPTQPPPPASRLDGPQRPLAQLRRLRHHVDARQVGVPVVRGLGHGVPLRRAGARRPGVRQVPAILLCREWFQHPNGALPAYEWDFDDVNPPVQAWAALEVFAIDGGRDIDFLSRIFDKLLVNFTWWVNREDEDGNNVFEGGFLGLDNIGPIDRSHLPVGGTLEQSDATGWMAFYALSMAAIAAILNRSGPARRPTSC